MNEKKKDLPAFPFYIGDWKKDPAIQTLTREYQMIWLDMLFLMWESTERGYLTINGKPMTSEMLQGALKLSPEKVEFCLTYFGDQLGLFSKREDGAIYSRKILKIIDLSKKRKISGSMGGNPVLVNQKRKFGKGGGYPNTENEIENESEDKDVEKGAKKNPLECIPPSLDEIIELCEARNYPSVNTEAQKFYNYYESNGWRVGRNKMKNWGSALSNWYTNFNNFNNNAHGKNKSTGNTKHERIRDTADSVEELIRNVTNRQ